MTKPIFVKLETAYGDDILLNTSAISSVENTILVDDDDAPKDGTLITLLDGKRITLRMDFDAFVDAFILPGNVVQGSL